MEAEPLDLVAQPFVGTAVDWKAGEPWDITALFAAAAAKRPHAEAVAADLGGSIITGVDGADASDRPAPATTVVASLAAGVDNGRYALTFAELRRLSLAIAAELRARPTQFNDGGGDFHLVAVCLGRTPVLVASLLGVLEVGAGYVPLEPSHPEARRGFIVEDSGARLVISGPGTKWPDGVIPEACIVRLVEPSGDIVPLSSEPTVIEAAGLVAQGVPGTNSENGRGASNASLAYLIYTSGSTGTPKGVLVSRISVLNVLHAFNYALRLGGQREDEMGEVSEVAKRESERATHEKEVIGKEKGLWNVEEPSFRRQEDECMVSVTTCCFDISVLEFFWPLCFGFRLFLASPTTARSGSRLAALLNSERPTLFQATPATFRGLLQAGWRGGASPERLTAICGGEAFPASIAAELRECCGRGVWNAYGPTEATIWCTSYRVPPFDGTEVPATVPIGEPLANTTLLVARVDSADGDDEKAVATEGLLEETAAGGKVVSGELLVTGAGVSRGYHRRPELTAAKFVACTPALVATTFFGGVPGVAYCTGDLIRIRTRECTTPIVEFAGRLDGQVKVRGFRVEPGEVEVVLEQQDGVRAAAVVVVDGEASTEPSYSGPTLAAYVVADMENPQQEQQQEQEPKQQQQHHEQQLRSALRGHLASRLPAYMVPRHFIFLSELPLMPSGKVDRKTLRERPLPSVEGAGEVGSFGVIHAGGATDATAEFGEVGGATVKSLTAVDWTAETSSRSEGTRLLREAIVVLVTSATGIEPPHGEDADLEALGVDSMSAVPLAEALSRHVLHGAVVPLEDIYVYSTLDALCAYLYGRLCERQVQQSQNPRHARNGYAGEHTASSPAKPGLVSAALATDDSGGNGVQVSRESSTKVGAATTAGGKRAVAPKQRQRRQRDNGGVDGDTAAAATPKQQPLPDPGMEACRSGDVDGLRKLIDAGKFDAADSRDRFGGSGLHWAAGAGHLEVCRLLVSSRASASFADKKSGRCALHWCTRQGHLAVAEWLVCEHGESVNVETKDATTPLQLAAWGDHVDVCEWLLQRGASLVHRNRWYCLSHHFAALAGASAACRWLHSKGVDLALGNDQGHNALHKAAYGGHQDLCEWLQDAVGLDPSSEEADARGQTPVDLARKAGYEELAEWLAARGRKNPPPSKNP